VAYRHAAPLLGEHTEQVLSERLGLSAEEIQQLMNT
jgi:crotonobetainyl-CoA:carnitine CoA-transferase CaiB-like acyl-CoA transferase